MKRIFLLAVVLSAMASSALAVSPGEALAFLYSSMSLPDRADYPEEFYRRNVEAAFRAKEEMPWGKSVPDREFLHFVLPVRVNNENLDDSRSVFYEELKSRVGNMSMKDAILEVNHWCHEKVTYRPSDGRTSSPLSSVSQAIGRCGEESTFTVAALRSVGIPARQIYTPRWAHTDDNHAWVEAWADGRWYFLGACEPEPVLNLGWFNDPASRGLLMSTNVVGDYQGPEEVLLKQPLSTRINVTSNYAPVGVLPVRVVLPDGTPVPDARVDFCIYNYAEYYPAVTKYADAYGVSSLKAGLGDVVVWASDGRRFGIAKGNPGDYAGGGELKVVLDMDPDFSGSFDLDIIPPVAGARLPVVTPAQRLENDRRLQYEDSLRGAYMATFATPGMARKVAGELGLDEDAMIRILTEARGNHLKIVDFLRSVDNGKRQQAVDLLLNVSEKDRRDVPMEVVADNIDYTACGADPQYVLNPRVEMEYLRPWRGILSGFFASDADRFRSDPSLLVSWVAGNISDAAAENPQGLRMSPCAVLSERKADPLSRDIFFVAAARSVGIPARIDPVTASPQYAAPDGSWIDVHFAKDEKDGGISQKGRLALTFSPFGSVVDPKYFSQFSISRIDNGELHLLEFDENGSLSSLFSSPYELDAGQYIITSGQRLAGGGVLAHSEIFTIAPGETATIPLIIRRDDSRLSVIGSLNAENIYHDSATDTDRSILSSAGRGYYVLGLIRPNHEPSAHALNDISAVAAGLEKTGRKILLLFGDSSEAERFRREMFPALPSSVVFGIDNEGVSRSEIVESLHLEHPADPIFVVADSFNRIVWVSSGYSIGLGEQLVRVLDEVDE